MNHQERRNVLREEARKLLDEGAVQMVVGFEDGSLPLASTPCFVTCGSDAEKLVWNSFCCQNLSGYLLRTQGRVGIVAKGCDTRAIVELLKEKQLRREDLVVIGVPCDGMLDRGTVRRRFPGEPLKRVEERDGELVIAGGSQGLSVPREECLRHECRVCADRNPVLHDVLAGEKVAERGSDRFEDVDEFAARSADERWSYIAGEMSRCIRCYACRNACPLCYCARCFVDSTQPQWVGKGAGVSDTLAFHLMRTLHTAGRCVECGACSAACPVNIDIRVLGRRMSADVARMFDYRPGLDMDSPAPLSSHRADDPEDFMLGEPRCGE